MEIPSLRSWLGAGSINLFGRPFAGKDTQGNRLAEQLGGTLLGGGDILRGSDMPPHIKVYMQTGKLIPTDDYIDIVLPYLSQEALAGKPLILSSVGRWHGEEEGVIEASKASEHPLKAVVHLALDETVVIERWHRLAEKNDRGARHDDTLAILDTRLREYREKTMPVIEYYRAHGLLIEVDGAQSPDDVNNSILQELVRKAH